MGEGDGEMGGATKNTGTDYSRRRDSLSLSLSLSLSVRRQLQ